jgi:hypothetical protein
MQRYLDTSVPEPGVRLGKEQAPTEGRVQWGKQKAVVAPGEDPGYGPGGVSADAVSQPPLAMTGLLGIHAQLLADSD